MKFSFEFCQNYTKHSSAIELQWQKWMSHGTGLYSNESLLEYSKSQKVSASYCLQSQHSRGKNQRADSVPLPPPEFFSVMEIKNN